MKRLVVCLAIIGAIIAAGIFSCAVVSSKNDKLYGYIQSVEEKYNAGESPEAEIAALDGFFKTSYAPGLACIVNDDELSELAIGISKLLPMYESGCDEFTAECEAIRMGARRIYRDEVPGFYRIL